ncbi:hypothetical protein Gpo141_00001108 [Globisporangium polare]
MVKVLVLATLSVFLSCVAAGGANPSTRNLRSMAVAEAQNHEAAAAAGAWAKQLGNAMESKLRPKNDGTSTTTGMEARVEAMNAPHRTMPSVVMEARRSKKHNKADTKKADSPRKKTNSMMEARNAHMKNLKAAPAEQRAKLEALVMEARNKKGKHSGKSTEKNSKHKGKKHDSMEAQGAIHYIPFSVATGKPNMTP